MNSDKVMIRELVSTITRHKWSIFFLVILTASFAVQLPFWMPKKYKADFEINVYSKYFKNPLISEIIPGVHQIPEMRFTIDSMIKEALDDNYMDSLAKEFGLYSLDLKERDLAKARQELRDRFRMFSSGGQSYKISFIYSDPHVAMKVMKKTLKTVKNHFISTRIKTIEMVKEVMVRRLESFNAAQNMNKSDSSNALASKNPEVLKSELDKLNANIAALQKQFNTRHPKVMALKSRRKVIQGWLKEFQRKGIVYKSTNTPVAFTNDKIVAEQLSSKFYTKYHDFTIALEVEKKSLESYIGIIKHPTLPVHPISPKKRLFAAVGLLMGLLFSFILVFYREIMAPSNEETLASEAKALNADVLGSLPKFRRAKIEKPVLLPTEERIQQ